jgi:hypothetical protein
LVILIVTRIEDARNEKPKVATYFHLFITRQWIDMSD